LAQEKKESLEELQRREAKLRKDHLKAKHHKK